MLIRLLLLYFLISFSAFSKNYIKPYAGCIDCFNFVAPTILGAENISPAEVGLIVYDSYFNSFRAYNSAGSWSKLSNEQSIRSVSSSANAYSTDDIIAVNAASGSITITLPAAATVPGKILLIKKTDSSSNSVIIDGNGSETIDGVGTKNLFAKNDLIKVVADGTGWLDISQKILRAPTIQRLTSGSGTYTTANGAIYIRVKMVGGGGGGSGSGSGGGTTGGTGGTSTFGSSLLTATGGGGGVLGNTGGSGGSATVNSPADGTRLNGGSGGIGGFANNVSYPAAGSGASTPFGGSGGGGPPGTGSGQAAIANTGSGGGGGGGNLATSIYSGSGGGAGAFIDAVISSPGSTYSYTVGAAGTAGSAGTNGYAGGAGGSGYIEVTEYYQ